MNKVNIKKQIDNLRKEINNCYNRLNELELELVFIEDKDDLAFQIQEINHFHKLIKLDYEHINILSHIIERRTL